MLSLGFCEPSPGSWRDLLPDYGDWKNTHWRFSRWRDKGIWKILLEQLVDEPDYEWLMIDASHVKVHPRSPHAMETQGCCMNTQATFGANYI